MKRLTRRAKGLKFKLKVATKVNGRRTIRPAKTSAKRSGVDPIFRDPKFLRMLRLEKQGKLNWHHKSLAQLRRELDLE